MRTYLQLLFTLFSIQFFFAQEGLPLYTDYLTDNLQLVHPSAVAAAFDGGLIRMTSRKQWMDIKNAPELQTISVQYRVDAHLGLGGVAFRDQNGYYSTTGAYVTLGRHINLKDNWPCDCAFPDRYNDLKQLSFGLNIGFVHNSLDQSSFDLSDYDPLITGIKEVTSYINMDAGVSYFKPLYNLHFTIKNILFSTHDRYGDYSYPFKRSAADYRRYILSGGGYFHKNRSYILEPSILFQYAEITREKTIDLNLKTYLVSKRGRFWIGASFRNTIRPQTFFDTFIIEAQNLKTLTPLIGFEKEKFIVSYNYTQQTGAVLIGNVDYHQITLGFNFGR